MHGFHVGLRPSHEHHRRDANQANARQVSFTVVLDGDVVDTRYGHLTARSQQQRVAVWFRTHHLLRPNRATGTAHIFDNNLPAQTFAQRLGNHPRDQIHTATRRITDDERDGLGLRPGLGQRRCHARGQSKTQQRASANR